MLLEVVAVAAHRAELAASTPCGVWMATCR